MIVLVMHSFVSTNSALSGLSCLGVLIIIHCSSRFDGLVSSSWMRTGIVVLGLTGYDVMEWSRKSMNCGGPHGHDF